MTQPNIAPSISDHYLTQLGGDCTVDVFNLSNGKSIAVTDLHICLYNSLDLGINDASLDDEEIVLVDLLASNPDLIVNNEGSSIKRFTQSLIELNDGFVFEINDKFEQIAIPE